MIDRYLMRVLSYPLQLLMLFGFYLSSLQAAEIEAPNVMLERISSEVFEVLKKQDKLLEAEPEKLFDVVQQYIIPHLDDVTMAKLALGKNWNVATNDQKIKFVDEFRELLVKTYGKSLSEFKDLQMTFFPATVNTSGTTRAVVRSEVVQPGGPTIPVSYKMRVKDDRWKVYDITIDGVSLVTSYRGTFTQEVRKGGIEGLLSMLRDRNQRSKS